jgi:hypothetical protein
MDCHTILPPFTRFLRYFYAQGTAQSNKHITRKELLNHIIHTTSIFNTYRNQFKMTNYDYRFTQQTNPFFQTPVGEMIDEMDVYNNTDEYLEIENVIASYKGHEPIVFNPYFMMLYISVNKINCAFTKGNWTIFSLRQIIDEYNIRYLEEPDIKWLTLGHAYMGLGHYKALRMDITNGGLFIQNDGGSNDYDRMAHWDAYKNQKLTEADYLTFEQVVEYMN